MPKGSTGAALICYSSGASEAEAVRETVSVIRQAEVSPLDVISYGTISEREEDGAVIDDVEKELRHHALEENPVIIAQMTTLYDKGKQCK